MLEGNASFFFNGNRYFIEIKMGSFLELHCVISFLIEVISAEYVVLPTFVYYHECIMENCAYF
jgi:hypothetical protein